MKRLSILLLLFILLMTGLCSGEVLTLDRSITIALENNLDIKQELITLKITSYQERAARALFYPAFSVIGTDLYIQNVPYMSRYAGAVMKQPLYSGGKLTNDLRAAQETKNAQVFNLHQSELTLENRVFREYMNCIRYWKFSKAYQVGIEKAAAQIEAVKKEVSAGRRNEADILRWQVLIDNYRTRLVGSDQNLANSRTRLNTLMNRPASEPLEVTDSHNLRFEYADFMIRQKTLSSDEMLEMYLDYGLVFSPSYKKKLKEILIADYNLRSQNATLLPTIDILSNYNGRSLPLFGIYNLWDTGLYLNFDLYRQQKYENIKISELQLESSKVKEQQFMRDFKSDIRTFYLTNSSYDQQVRLQRKQQKISRQYLGEISDRYLSGGASNLDVIEAFDNFFTNQITLVDYIYNAFTELANLYNLIGFSFTYAKPAPNLFWRYKEHGLDLDYDLKSLEDPKWQFMDDPDFEHVKATFEANPSLYRETDKSGQTALHYAVDRGYVKCVELLLKNGADPNAVNFLDGTPLVRAICYCPPDANLQIVNLLISNGADVNKVSHIYAPLNWAAMKNRLDIVKALVRAGANINGKDEYMKLTALHFSAFWGSVEMAKFLIESGADMSIENDDGLTAYDLAWQFEHKELIEYFEKIGAK